MLLSSILKSLNLNNTNNMDITAKITGIKYKVNCADNLPIVNINDFNINSAPSYFLLSEKQYGISK